MAKLSEVFGRINEYGTVSILYIEDGAEVDRIEDCPFPVIAIPSTWAPDSTIEYATTGVAGGLVISLADARKLNIEIEAYHG